MNRPRGQWISSFLTFVLILMLVSPSFVVGEIIDEPLKRGPYVDKIIFDVIREEDRQVIALQNAEIDIIDQHLNPAYIGTLEEAEEIQVERSPKNGYGYITINCAKYPLNITAFRRALAFATDKDAISADIWDGLAQPLDSLFPSTNPFSIEGQLPYTYYAADSERGNALLDAAGFIDIDNDGYREAPDGSDFDIIIECAQNSHVAIDVGQIIVDALTSLDIEASSVPTDFYEYLNRLYFHEDYDIVFIGDGWNSFDIDWIAYEYWSEYATDPYWNFPNWRNSTYDSWRDQLLYATTYEELYEAAIEMQKIWVYECPLIVCYENYVFSAYRTDEFEGFVNTELDGVPSRWTNLKVHQKVSLGNSLGGTFIWSTSLDIDSFNFMTSISPYAQNINQMLHESLLAIGPDGNDVKMLAESYTIETHDDDSTIIDGHTKMTFSLIQNATWTDGMPLSAEDVAFTLSYYKDAPSNRYGSDLTDLVSTEVESPYILVVEFDTESIWHLHSVGYKPILPKHVFENQGPNNWNLWNPDPPTIAMVTSGPFNVSEYVAGEFIELTYTPNYFFRPETGTDTNNSDSNRPPNDHTLVSAIGMLGIGVFVLILGYFLKQKR